MTKCTSPQPGIVQALGYGATDSRAVCVIGLANLIRCAGSLSLLLLAAPCFSKAVSPPENLMGFEQVQFDGRGPLAVGTGIVQLAQQEAEHRHSSGVEVLPAVAPQCGAVTDEQADQKCQQGKPGGTEQLGHDKSVLKNVMLAIVTLVAGFAIGGGFGGGR